MPEKILEYLREIERRRLFLEMGYPSLYEFCTRELKYSEASAHRRISAMRLVRELPQVEDKIVSGELSLSVVAQAQTFFRKQAKSSKVMLKEEKLQLMQQLENSSARQCEKILVKLEPELARKDQARAISDDLTEIRMTVDREFYEMLERLKNLLGHVQPDISSQDVLKKAMHLLLEKKDPLAKSPPTSAGLTHQN